MASEQDWTTVEKQRFLALLRRIGNLNSFTRNRAGANEVQEVLAQVFRDLGMAVERVEGRNFGDVLVGRSKGWRKGGTLLVGHADTVHPPESEFCCLTLDGDRVFGPGTADMKGGLALIVSCLERLAESGSLSSIPCAVCINADEEAGSPESKRVLQEVAKEAGRALVFEWGRGEEELITRRKGVAVFEVEVRGRSSHAGNAHEEGRNAIVHLCRVLLELNKLTSYDAGDTWSVGTIRGGVAENVVPDSAVAGFEFRAFSSAGFDRLHCALESIGAEYSGDGLTVTFRQKHHCPPMEESNRSLALLDDLQRLGLAAGVNWKRLEITPGGGSNANDLAALGVPTIDGLGPLGFGAHTNSEHIVLSSVPPRISTVARFLEDSASARP